MLEDEIKVPVSKPSSPSAKQPAKPAFKFELLAGTSTMEKRMHDLNRNRGILMVLEDEMLMTKTLNKYNTGGDDM